MVDPRDASVEWAVRIQTSAGDQIVRYSVPSRANAERDLAEALRLRSPGELVHLVQRRVSPWQRAGEALPDLVAPPTAAREVPALVCLDEAEATGPAVSPDCRDGKCAACVGEAWDEGAGEVTECEHPCHAAACARCNPASPTAHRQHTCADRGPYGTTCTDYPGHRYSHYDAGDDSSWQDGWRGDCDRGHVPPDQTA